MFCFITARNLHHSSILTVDYYCHVETAPWAVVKTPLTKLPVMLIQALINRGMYNGIQNVPWYFLASGKKKSELSENSRNDSVLHYSGVLGRKKNLSFIFVVNVMLLNVPYEGFSGRTK